MILFSSLVSFPDYFIQYVQWNTILRDTPGYRVAPGVECPASRELGIHVWYGTRTSDSLAEEPGNEARQVNGKH